MKINFLNLNFYFLLSLICLNSCLSHSAENQSDIYFNLNNLLHSQITLLDSLKPSVKKTVVDNTTETQTRQISDWRKELKMFLEADINKSIYKGYYKVEKNAEEQKYIAQKSALKTRLLRIKYLANSQQISHLRIKYQDINFLYTSKKTLELYFNPRTQLITSYEIKGTHRNLFGISSEYSVKGEMK
jgi:hypothetical protein